MAAVTESFWRQRFTPQVQVMLFGTAVGVGLLLLGLSLWQVRTVLPVGSSFQAGVSEEMRPGATPSAKLISVDIAGAVNKPGLYQVKSPARFSEALKLAEGLHPKADLAYVAEHVNLAKKIKDEEKIYIPFQDGQSSSNQVEKGKVGVNSASSQILESLSGIGPKKAEEIIQNRPYTSFEEFQQKAKISAALFQKIQANLSLN